MRQHYIWCVRALCSEKYIGLVSGIPLQINRTLT